MIIGEFPLVPTRREKMAAVKVSPPPRDCKDASLKHVRNVLSKRGVTPGKTSKILIFLFVLAFGIRVNAQSDCGNCWTAGHSCTVVVDCGDQALQCTDFVACDYAPCSYYVTYCAYALGKDAPRKERNRFRAPTILPEKSVITPFRRENSLNLFSYFATISNTLHIPIAWFIPNRG